MLGFLEETLRFLQEPIPVAILCLLVGAFAWRVAPARYRVLAWVAVSGVMLLATQVLGAAAPASLPLDSGNPPQPQGYSSLPNIKNALNDYGGYSSSADKFHITYFTSGQKALYVSTIVDRIWHDADPAVSSVYLRDEYFPYFSRDYNSGHFQVVRGYYLYVGTTYDPHIRIFEPFNENRFWSSRPVTSGPQVVTDDQLYNATMAQPSNRIAAS